MGTIFSSQSESPPNSPEQNPKPTAATTMSPPQPEINPPKSQEPEYPVHESENPSQKSETLLENPKETKEKDEKPEIDPTKTQEPEYPIQETENPVGKSETLIEKGEEMEEEDEEECGFCRFMKGGECKETFINWEKCVEEGEKNDEDIVDKCFEVTSNLKKCMEANQDYYGVILQAEKAAEQQVMNQLDQEKDNAAIAANSEEHKPE